MNMQEDKFFDKCRESLSGFAPEVPASVYAGVQKKLMWSSFLSFSTTTLNVWYVAAVIGAATAGSVYLSAGEYSGQTLAETNGKAFSVKELAQSSSDKSNTLAYTEVAEETQASINVTTKSKSFDKPANSKQKNHAASGDLNDSKGDSGNAAGAHKGSGTDTPDLAPELIAPPAIECQLPVQHLEFSTQNSVELNDLLNQLKSDKGEVVIKVHTNK